MSAAMVLKVWCDGCFPDCLDVTYATSRERLGAGWVYVGRNFDLCPNCAAKTPADELVETARRWSQ